MFCQTQTTCRPLKSPPPSRNGPICSCMTLFVPSVLQCVMQQKAPFHYCGGGVMGVNSTFLSLVTLTFKTHPSNGPKTSFLLIWHVSVQWFLMIFDSQAKKNKKSQTVLKTEPYSCVVMKWYNFTKSLATAINSQHGKACLPD